MLPLFVSFVLQVIMFFIGYFLNPERIELRLKIEPLKGKLKDSVISFIATLDEMFNSNIWTDSSAQSDLPLYCTRIQSDFNSFIIERQKAFSCLTRGDKKTYKDIEESMRKAMTLVFIVSSDITNDKKEAASRYIELNELRCKLKQTSL